MTLGDRNSGVTATGAPSATTPADHCSGLPGRADVLSRLTALATLPPAAGPVAILLTGDAGIGRTTTLARFLTLLPAGTTAIDLGRRPATSSGRLSGPSLHHDVAAALRRGRAVLALDDAQRAPQEVLHALDYVLRRTAGNPVTTVVTLRTPSHHAELLALTQLLFGHAWITEELLPLTTTEVAQVLQCRTGRRTAGAEAARWRQASLGVPALLLAIAAGARCASPARHDEDDEDDDPAGPDDAVTARVLAELLRAELRDVPAGVRTVTALAAVLDDTTPGVLARRAEAELRTVTAALDLLRCCHILGTDGTFRSAATRQAVILATGRRLRQDLVRRAAAELDEEGGPTEQVANLLLQLSPCDQPWMLSTLLGASDQAAAQDRPHEAVHYLRHALDAAPPGAAPPALRLLHARLAPLLAQHSPAESVPHFRFLLQSAPDRRDFARTALAASEVLVGLGKGGEAADLLTGVLPPSRSAGPGPGSSRTAAGSPRPDPHEAVDLQAARLLAAVLGQADREQVRRYAEDLQQENAADVRGPSRLARAGFAFGQFLAGHEQQALGTLDLLDAGAGLRPGDQISVAAALVRAMVLGGNEPVARTRERNQAILRAAPGGEVTTVVRCLLAMTATMAGDVPTARQELRHARSAGLRSTSWHYPLYLMASGVHHLVYGNQADALSAFLACGRLVGSDSLSQPARLAWWLPAARLLAASGRLSEARLLVHPVRQAALTWQSPQARAFALLAVAAAYPADAVPTLREACALVSGSQHLLAECLAQQDLGKALLRTGDLEPAGQALQVALHRARALGATPYVLATQRLLAEVTARPRGSVRSAPTRALTPAQWRVAVLAAEGHTNARIAEDLVVSRRTVELHLTYAYRKLGVSCREELAGAIADLGHQPADRAS